jgi:uncharacterized protein (TIGR03437 family)
VTATAGNDLSTSFVLIIRGATPELSANGVVNAASFEPGLVPGSLATVFGAGLSTGVSGTVALRGEDSYAGTFVTVGGFRAPLVSITGPPDEQISFQVPFELNAGAQTTVTVENNGSSSTIGGIAVFSTQPGIFLVPWNETTTLGALIHASSGALVTPDNPARRGEAVSLFFTGGGRVNPPAQTGQPAVGVVPLMTQDVVVGIDHKGSVLLFQGYAPGFIGLYQVNAVVPSDAACGVVPLNIRVGDVTSPVTSTAVACP